MTEKIANAEVVAVYPNKVRVAVDDLLNFQAAGECSGQQKLATALEFFQNNLSDSFGVKPPLY